MKQPKPPDPLLETSALLQLIVESTDDLVTVVDERARFLYVNPAAERVFGLSVAECIGRSAFDFVHEDDRESTSRAFQGWLAGAREGSFVFENRQVSVDGGTRLLRWTITPHHDDEGQLSCMTSIAKDVTATHKVTGRLAENELRLRALLSGMLDGLVTIDHFGVIQDVSNSVEVLFGYEPRELVGQNIRVLMPEPARSEHDLFLAHYRETGETSILNQIREFEVLRKDGTPIICEISVARIDIPGKDAPIFCGTFRDITERKRAERALVESERRFHAVFDQEYQFVGLLDAAGRVLDINQAALEASRAAREEVIGKPFWDAPWWMHSAEIRQQLKEWTQVVAEGGFVRSEVEFRAYTGEMRTVDFSMKAVRDEHGEPTLLISEGRDITVLKRSQRRETAMLKALATIGESASLLAHEIKNPITAVNTALRAVAKQLGEDERQVLEELVHSMQKLEKKMRRTLSFVKPHDIHAKPCDVGALLRGPVNVLRTEAQDQGVDLACTVAAECPEVMADHELLDEVIVNMIRNSLDALDGPGRVDVRGDPHGEDFVQILVDDDGPGIPADMLETLFHPYTTSKAEGTGLGLALSRKIIEEHGGTVEAGASPLGGARFTIQLPVVGT